MSKLGIGTRIYLLAFFLLTVVAGLTALDQRSMVLSQVRFSAFAVASDQAVAASEVQTMVQRLRNSLATAALGRDSYATDEAKANFSDLKEVLTQVRDQALEPALRVQLADMLDQIDGLRVALETSATASAAAPGHWEQAIDNIEFKALDLWNNQSRVMKDIRSDTQEKLDQTRTLSLAASGAALLLAPIVAFLVAHGLAKPIRGMSTAMTRLAEGDTELAISGQDLPNEIGAMARSVVVFRDSMVQAGQLTAAEARERKASEARSRRMEELTRQFDQAVSRSVTLVEDAARHLQSTSHAMSHIATSSHALSEEALVVSQQAAAGAETVAATTEELTASAQAISDQVHHSAQIAAEAVQEADDSARQIDHLAETGGRILTVVELIGRIASQTNILALNATIESARAGAAGQGFAVVAGEIMSLAKATSRATVEVSDHVNAVRNATTLASTSLGTIHSVIGQINEVSTLVSAAVAQQDSATTEIARTADQVSKGIRAMHDHMTGVAEAARRTGSTADELRLAADSMTQLARQLRGQIDIFLADIRGI